LEQKHSATITAKVNGKSNEGPGRLHGDPKSMPGFSLLISRQSRRLLQCITVRNKRKNSSICSGSEKFNPACRIMISPQINEWDGSAKHFGASFLKDEESYLELWHSSDHP
jgi:hypothetical protein